MDPKPTGNPAKMIACPACGEPARVEQDGRLGYHDDIPPCRQVCRASRKFPDEAAKMARKRAR